MKKVHMTDRIVPLAEFRAQAAKLLKRLGASGKPIVITQNGRPAGVLLSPREFDRIQERERFLESIAAGLADAEAGNVIGTAELKKRLRSERREAILGQPLSNRLRDVIGTVRSSGGRAR
jgi:prevent-host-death family protein